MTTPPEPPPNMPAHQSFEFDSLSWWGRSGIWMVAIVVVAIYLMQPPYRGSRKNANQSQAVSNARQIGLALFEFESKYGKFPDVSTIADVRKDAATDPNLSKMSLGTKSSNDYFRQLLACGFAPSESMFYANILGAKKPDNDIKGAEALKKGECGFAFLAGLSAAGNPSRPLIVTPLILGTDRFDPKRFDGKAIIMRMDNSVSSININSSGYVMSNGKNLLDPTNPVWGKGDKFVIAWPDL